ncbi:hypothetical protein ASE74_22755 [Pedobacter sp. Leaf216]|uniref:hypothetical protein n=1 Tax=Pedobacter sp. Leaf216 TaxID=1735684 RepID=UPI0006F4B236|nr:hypothetical protein [Pedobacter sp. Leaf216]KQM72574.1 hypothetical protein ASE74_22755 [Pedobacter sp. Leaf216]
MENEQEKTSAENNSNHPKPTDDVQMNIETVIPSTEKEVKTENDAEESNGEQTETGSDNQQEENQSDDGNVETVTPEA